jgi:CIC family chloride channel protein
MKRFERSGVWNLLLKENNQYLEFVSKDKLFNAFRKKLQKQKEG